MKKDTLVVNLFAGPGAGKSSLMAGIFSYLKFRGIDCEMAPEFAKEKVWEGSLDVLRNQVYVFGKQHHAITRLLGKVDVVITDSPLLLSIYYSENKSPNFKNLVMEEHKKMRSLNFMIVRKKKYNANGRMQTEEEAKKIDHEILSVLRSNGVRFLQEPGEWGSIKRIGTVILKEIKKQAHRLDK